ncbi:MAG: EAL domain-containing protein, partial [Chromatiales bacterium]|nr:EAL domain-containing protein [Chromatiales bacterium]
VMNRAITQCAHCHQEGFKLKISINLAVKNLLNDNLSGEVKALLDKHQLSSRHVIFEVTESSMMANPEHAITVLNELSDIGVGLSVDDFGTGFSSLAYLKQLPVNELKIDKSFVMEMENNDSDAVIVHSTIELGHNLGLSVVAEGVENQQTCDILKHYGCDLVQGYFIARPLPADEFMLWLKAHTA